MLPGQAWGAAVAREKWCGHRRHLHNTGSWTVQAVQGSRARNQMVNALTCRALTLNKPGESKTKTWGNKSESANPYC